NRLMAQNIATLLGRVAGGVHLSLEEMSASIDAIMRGQWSDDEIGLLLTALAAKGETVDEVAGAAMTMRRHMTPIRSRHAAVLDTCGTGGGGSKMFNVSTTAAIVSAAAGVPVAKHGNRSITSCSGSADVLAELGVNINATVSQVEACLDELGICFCFAPLMHPSMKHVAAVRKRLGIRTIFNILGPLVNPAGACYQLLGAGRPEMRPLLAGAMARLGTKRTLVVSGEDGLGDVTLSGVTHVTEVTTNLPLPPGEGRGEGAREFTWTPEDFGLSRASLDSLAVDGPRASAAIIRGILKNARGPARDIVILNAAAGLIASGRASDPKSAAGLAAEAIDSGAAETLLHRLAEKSHAPA
ncbi:MAG TPA: anthranilate phosphoribosyltransferase, partial [Lacipirellulaceae bacterium]|nr:anthranilate phosphoribosyltransferase [Lacipirellulaceae bacterium]